MENSRMTGTEIMLSPEPNMTTTLGKTSSTAAAALRKQDEVDFDKVLRLFTHEDTIGLHDRQLSVLRRICKLKHLGDLGSIEQLFPLIEDRIDSISGRADEFRMVLLRIISLCSLPPLPERANEGITEWGLVTTSSLLRALGGALWSSDQGVQIAAANSLRRIASGNVPPSTQTPNDEVTPREVTHCDDLRPLSKDLNQALLLECGVVSAAVSRLDTTMDALLKILLEEEDNSMERSIDESVNGSKSRNEVDDEIFMVSGATSIGIEEVKTAIGDDKSRINDLNMSVRATTGVERGVLGEVLLSVLQLIRELSTSAASSAIMVQGRLMTLLVRAFHMIRGIRDQSLAVAIEIIWNCLEHSQTAIESHPPSTCRTQLIIKARKRNAAFALSEFDSMVALRKVLKALLVGGFRKKDKDLRNEVVIVVSQVAKSSRSHSLFRTTGILRLLLHCATVIETGLIESNPSTTEVESKTATLITSMGNPEEDQQGGQKDSEHVKDQQKSRPRDDPRNFATIAEVDLEFKILLWSLLADLTLRDEQNLVVVEGSALMETLLMYIDLVVEEGPSADFQITSMNRSVSLASMTQSWSGMHGPSGCSLDEKVGHLRTPDDTCQTQLIRMDTNSSGPSCPVPGNAQGSFVTRDNTSFYSIGSGPCSGPGFRYGPDLHSDLGKNTNELTKQNESSAALENDVSTRRSKEKEMGLAITQLYVPAMVERLPLTSLQVLQAQAMASLLVLAPRLPYKFQVLGGHVVTLRLLDRLGSRPENHDLVTVATKLLVTVVGLPGLREELGNMGGVPIMLKRLAESSLSSDELRADTIIILCRLCEASPVNQEAFRQADGIPTVMSAIKEYCCNRSYIKQQEKSQTNPLSSVTSIGSEGGRGRTDTVEGSFSGPTAGLELSLGGGGSSFDVLDPTMVHIVDCLWCAVVGNRRSEARLLQCEGLDTLLDLLELCPAVMRHQVTGVVADLLGNKRAIPYAQAWRSDCNMLSISQLMVRLWIAEEARLGVSRPGGILQNIWHPLQSHEMNMQQTLQMDSESPNIKRAGMVHRPASSLRGHKSSERGGNNVGNVRNDCPKQSETEGERVEGELDCERGAWGTEEWSTENVNDSRQPQSLSSPLRLALLSGSRRTQGSSITTKEQSLDQEAALRKSLRHLDLRSKLAAVLRLVGCGRGAVEGLGPNEVQALYMATKFLEFRAAEAWQEVAEQLEAQNVHPIAPDALMLEKRLEHAFEQAHKVKSKQMTLTGEQGEFESAMEAQFFASIIFQRDQEIRQALIKLNAQVPGKLKRRMATKRVSEESLRQDHGESITEEADISFGLDQDKCEKGGRRAEISSQLACQ